MIISYILDLFAPEYCLECGAEGFIWCDYCRLSHEPIPSRCFVCHKQTANFATCASCRNKTGLKAVYVYGEYKNLYKNLIVKFKFSSKRHAHKPIARAMADVLPFCPSKAITFVPIPSSPTRARQRGFDHTVLLAKELSKIKNQNFANLLIRTNDIQQVGSNKKVRQTQIKDSFRLKRVIERLPEHVVLVDDVVTTGATLSEATRTLKKAGVKKIDAIVFAYSK